MSTLNTTEYFQEPTRDEIAMSAFLAWEKDGRPADRELHYWLAAEGQLRALRLKKAEAAAKAAAKTTAKSPLPKSAKLTTSVKRETTTTTVASVTKPATKPPASTTTAKRQVRPTTSAARH